MIARAIRIVSSINYRQMQHGEETQVIDLVSSVFYKFVASLYSDAGVTEFMKYADTSTLAERIQGNNFVLIAELNNEITGIIEISENSHIALFFVAPNHQRKGLGRELLSRAVHTCIASDPKLIEITVNSSPNAVSAYRALGFIEIDEEKTSSGIRFVPMSLKFDKVSRSQYPFSL